MNRGSFSPQLPASPKSRYEPAPPTSAVPPRDRAGYDDFDPDPRPRRAPRTYYRNQGPGNRAIGGLFAILIITIVIIAAAAALSSSNLTSSITDGVSDRAGQLIGLGGDGDGSPVEVPEAPAEPVGDWTWVLTQEELNNRIAARSGSFGPASDVQIELNDGTVTVRFRAYGVNGTYHGSLIAQDGVPVVADSKIDGPIGWVVGSDRIDDVLNEEIARAVAEQNVSVESVHVQPGQVVFGVSG